MIHSSNIKYISGLTLLELMISLLIGSVVALAVFSVFAAQSSIMLKQAGRTLATEEGREVFTLTSNLIKQAQASSITITKTSTSSTISFLLLSDIPIWPNDIAPYTDNAIQFSWTSQGSVANQILLIKAAGITALSGATPIPLAGDATGKNTKITDMSLITQGDGSFRYVLAVESGSNLGPVPQKTFFEGVVLPRN